MISSINPKELFPFFDTDEGRNSVYFDNAARSLIPEPVISKIIESIKTPFGNKKIAGYKNRMAKLLRIDPEDLFFTMGAHMSMERIIRFMDIQELRSYVIDPLSHKAVTNPIQMLAEQKQAHFEFMDLDANFMIDPDKLIQHLDSETSCVIVNQVSNITGLEQPLKNLYENLQRINEEEERNILLIVDASQGFSRCQMLPKADIVFCALQKNHSLPGCLTIFSKRAKQLLSGSHDLGDSQLFLEEYYNAGTPHFETIVSAVENQQFIQDLDDGLYIKDFDRFERLKSLTQIIYEQLNEIENIEFLGIGDQNIGHNRGILSFGIDGANLNQINKELKDCGIFLRCAEKDIFQHYFCVPNSHVIFPNLDRWQAALRISLHWYNDVTDVRRFMTLLRRHLK